MECGGPEAAAHLERLAPPGDRVTVRGDPSQDREDRYGRLLAYVTPRGGRQLNRGLVEAGWARVYVYDARPFSQVGPLAAKPVEMSDGPVDGPGPFSTVGPGATLRPRAPVLGPWHQTWGMDDTLAEDAAPLNTPARVG